MSLHIRNPPHDQQSASVTELEIPAENEQNLGKLLKYFDGAVEGIMKTCSVAVTNEDIKPHSHDPDH